MSPSTNPRSMKARNCDAKGRAVWHSWGEQSIANLGHRWEQAEVGQGAAACHRLWWTLDLLCLQPLLPLSQPTAVPEEGKFAASFLHVTWKTESSAGVLLPSLHLGSPREDLYDCMPKAPKILDNTHLNKQGLLLSVQSGVLEIICKHNCGLRINKYYCAEAFIKYGIARYSLTTSRESVLLRSVSFSASWVQSPPAQLGFFVGWFSFSTPRNENQHVLIPIFQSSLR